MKRKIKFTTLIYSIFFIIMFIFAIIIIGFQIYESYDKFNKTSKKLKTDFIEQKKEMIKHQVDKAVEMIKIEKNNAKKILKVNIKSRTNEALDIANHIYKINKGKKSHSEIKSMIKEALRPIRYSDGKGYFFIGTTKGNTILSPSNPRIEGKNLLKAKSKQLRYVSKGLIDSAKNKTNKYFEYVWTKPGKSGENFNKISYTRQFKPYNWVIGTGEYLADVEDRLKEDILERIGRINYGKGGNNYIFVLTFDGIGLMTNKDQRHLIGKNLWDIEDPNGVKVVHEERKAAETPNGDFIYYLWPKPKTNTNAPKTAFVRGVKDWRWMVGGGIFLDEVDEEILLMKSELDQKLKRDIIKIILLYIFALMLFLPLLYVVNRYLKQDFNGFISFFNNLSDSKIKIDKDKIKYSELESLAIHANDMLDELIDSEERRYKAEQELVQSQKMETVGTLAGGLAHDFNNVLGGITGSLSILRFKMKKGDVSKETINKYLDTIEQSGDRAKDMVLGLLSLSRKQELNLEKIDLNVIVNEVVKIIKNSFDKSIDINFETKSKSAIIDADRTQLTQVILNFCLNAAHAMTIMKKNEKKWGGKLSINLDKIFADKYFRKNNPNSKELNYCVLSIKDDGVGMSKDTISQIFNPFFTTKGKGKGTGLGLSMVYNIIENHNGFINVYSELKIGSTFNIYLPLCEDKEVGKKSKKKSKSLSKRRKGLVLVVDDEKVMRTTSEEILIECGYKVILAKNGKEGLEIFKHSSEKIKFTIMDMAMPEMNGKEAYIKMKKIDPKLKVLLTSGFKQDKRVQKVLDLGVNGFLQKPFTFDQLLEETDKII